MRRSVSVWRWQLMLAVSATIVAALIAGFRPDLFANVLFTLGMLGIVMVTLITFITPWEKLPSWVILIVPFADIVAIGFTTYNVDVRLGFLWVFPITWIASYASMAVVIAAIATVSACLVLGSTSGAPSDVMLRVMVTMLSLGFLGTTIHIGTKQARAARRLLRRQSEQLNRVALRAETHERRVTQIIDSLDLALAAVVEDGSVVKMNDAYRRLYRREMLGNLPSRAVEYDDRQGEPLAPECTSLARAARGEQMDGERIWLFDTVGEWRALQVSSQSIASVDTRGTTTLLMIEDVTELLAATEERRSMTAIVSHELRNPLTAIIGHIDLLRERDDLPERAQEQLAIVANASERMESLIVRALDETRPAPSTLSEPVDLRQLVDASVASFLPTATSSRLQVEVEGAETLMLYGDAFRIRQILDNLISNAVKYTPAGGQLVVNLAATEDGQAELQISDTGMGMSPEDVDSIFQPYFRAEQAAASGTPGTGLGMGVVREIINTHNGTISIASEPGVGTSVTVRLPRRPAKKETA